MFIFYSKKYLYLFYILGNFTQHCKSMLYLFHILGNFTVLSTLPGMKGPLETHCSAHSSPSLSSGHGMKDHTP